MVHKLSINVAKELAVNVVTVFIDILLILGIGGRMFFLMSLLQVTCIHSVNLIK